MATIVNTMEEDAALAVVRFTAELSWAVACPEFARLCAEAQQHLLASSRLDLASCSHPDLLLPRSPTGISSALWPSPPASSPRPGVRPSTLQIARAVCNKLVLPPTSPSRRYLPPSISQSARLQIQEQYKKSKKSHCYCCTT